MSAFTLSSDCHALLCELQLQRAASTRYLQDTLYPQHTPEQTLTDTLNQLQHLGLIRQRTEQQWSLTAEGTLTLILAVRAGECPMPQWSRIPSVTGLERAQEVVRELCLGQGRRMIILCAS